MKKKFFLGLGIAVVILGIFLISIFLFITKDVAYSVNDQIVTVENLVGDWIVTRYAESPVENEYWKFDENTVADYRDGSNDAYLVSEYEINSDGYLQLTDLSKQMIIEGMSNNSIKLIETDTKTVWYLLKMTDTAKNDFNRELIGGTWRVTVQAGASAVDEIMVFENGIISDYRGEGKELYFEGAYEWNEEGNLYVEKMALELKVYQIDSDTIALVETDTGYIWEMSKVE